jgi:hypothetical protein
VWNIALCTITPSSGSIGIQAIYGAMIIIEGSSATVQSTVLAGVCIAASAGGFISISSNPITLNLQTESTGLQTSWGGTIITNGLTFSSTGATPQGSQAIFVSGGVVQIDPSTTVTYATSNTIYNTANVYAYAGGILGCNGITFIGGNNVIAARYVADSLALIATGGGGSAYWPGSISGSATHGGIYT